MSDLTLDDFDEDGHRLDCDSGDLAAQADEVPTCSCAGHLREVADALAARTADAEARLAAVEALLDRREAMTGHEPAVEPPLPRTPYERPLHQEPRPLDPELPTAAWGCWDCKHNHTGVYVPDGMNPRLFDGRCMESIQWPGTRSPAPSCSCPRRAPEPRS